MSKKCMFFNRLADGSVRCTLCPRQCHIANGKHGLCGSRRNEGGELVSDVYARPCALAIDPIEKKPLAMFMPGTQCLSVACTGCNLRCLYCQNHDISQVLPDDVPCDECTPRQLVELAERYHCPSIAYTYTEPLTWYEYTYDTARLAHEHKLKNVLVTAGYINEEPARRMAEMTDAANIDLKSFSDEIYVRMNGAHLQPVLNTIKIFCEAQVHVELTNLLIPNVNDSHAMIKDMCQWLVSQGMSQVPLHFTRFFPRYKWLNTEPTPLATLHDARHIAVEMGMKHVFLGNV